MLAAGIFSAVDSRATGPGLNVNDRAPDLSAFGIVGSLPDLEGKVVLVDFWASWCSPCKASFPSMDDLYTNYRDKGFEIVAISVDANTKKMTKFIERRPVSFPVVHDVDKRLVKMAQLEAMPTSYLVGRGGTIRFVHKGWYGKKSAMELEKEIEILLEERL